MNNTNTNRRTIKNIKLESMQVNLQKSTTFLICIFALAIFSTLFTIYEARTILMNAAYEDNETNINNAMSIVDYYQTLIDSGKITRAKAQQEVLGALKEFNNSTDMSTYIAIVDYSNPNAIINLLDNKKFEKGYTTKTLIKDEKDLRGYNFHEDLTYKAIRTGKGYATYYWYNPRDLKRPYKKMGLAKRDANWQWVFITGRYVSDIHDAVFHFVFGMMALYVGLLAVLFFIISILKNRSVELMVNRIEYPSWYRETSGKFKYINKTFKDYYNVTIEDLQKYPRKFVSKDEYDIINEEDMEVFQTGILKYIQRDIVHNGETRTIEIFKVPIFNLFNKVSGLAGIFRDITEQKEIENSKDEFISIISHELRTPLTSMIGPVDLILNLYKPQLSEKAVSMFEIVQRNLTRLKSTVNKILDVSKIDAGAMSLTIKKIDVIQTIKDTLKELEAFAMKYNVNVRYSDNINVAMLNVDELRFKQILTNLLSNAIKYSETGANVDVDTEIENKQLKISVTNYNAPISEEQQEKMFTRYGRIEYEGKPKEGSGLGMYITKQLVKNMNGQISFESNEKRTTFYVEFNLALNK